MYLYSYCDLYAYRPKFISWTCIIMMLMSFGSSFQTLGGLPIYRDSRELTTDMQFVSLRIYSCEKSIDQPCQICLSDTAIDNRGRYTILIEMRSGVRNAYETANLTKGQFA